MQSWFKQAVVWLHDHYSSSVLTLYQNRLMSLVIAIKNEQKKKNKQRIAGLIPGKKAITNVDEVN